MERPWVMLHVHRPSFEAIRNVGVAMASAGGAPMAGFLSAYGEYGRIPMFSGELVHDMLLVSSLVGGVGLSVAVAAQQEIDILRDH